MRALAAISIEASASTVAAPPMSFFMFTMLLAGLICGQQSRGVSKQRNKAMLMSIHEGRSTHIQAACVEAYALADERDARRVLAPPAQVQ